MLVLKTGKLEDIASQVQELITMIVEECETFYPVLGSLLTHGLPPQEALQMGYLRPSDTIMMHQNEVLFAAVAEIKAMHAANYKPQVPRLFPVAGIEGHAQHNAPHKKRLHYKAAIIVQLNCHGQDRAVNGVLELLICYN